MLRPFGWDEDIGAERMSGLKARIPFRGKDRNERMLDRQVL